MNVFEDVYKDWLAGWLSNCCSAPHDGRFEYDDEWEMGMCVQCGDNAEFIYYGDEDNKKQTKKETK